VRDRQAGYTAAWTDANVLGPGGVYTYHYATFDQITARDFGVTPPAQGIQPTQRTYPVPDGPTSPNPQLTNGMAVVLHYYQDLSNHDYQDAWNLGGSNLNRGTGYAQWVAGYDTTASISVTGYGTWSDGTVWTHISAVQTDGSVRTYDGTYAVANGEIVSANITQTSSEPGGGASRTTVYVGVRGPGQSRPTAYDRRSPHRDGRNRRHRHRSRAAAMSSAPVAASAAT
jgi:hypothetical protein